jgi:UDP-N-acetylmuramoyl-tripeptide--D-alanyl-D-alanine ligase
MNTLQTEEIYQRFIQADYKICTDTRNLDQGAIFFALKGDNFNGNSYALKALELGCSFALVDELLDFEDSRIIQVSDVLSSLQDLATFHRKKFNIPMLALTGSNGKTTSKELIHACLSQQFDVLATHGNLNNHIGVPLTLLRLRPHHQFAIIEMGANHLKEIQSLCEIAQPNFGYITNFGKAHLEGFGSLDGVVQGKTELYRYIISKGGKLFINAEDNKQVSQSKSGTTIEFNVSNEASKSTTFISQEPYINFNLNSYQVQTHLMGLYNYINICAAVKISSTFGVSDEKIARGLANYIPQNNRTQIIETGKNQIILDAYNANPSSMQVALDNLESISSDSKQVILGDMFELGTESDLEHEYIIREALRKNFDFYLFIGEAFYDAFLNSNISTPKAKAIRSKSDLSALNLNKELFSKGTTLVKGSRGMALENLIPQNKP